MSIQKRFVAVMVVAQLVASCALPVVGAARAYATPLPGSGTSDDPYQISDCVGLQSMNDNLFADYVLTADIDCSDTINWNSGKGFAPIGGTTLDDGFGGTFDGRGHTISNLAIGRDSEEIVGLFGFFGGQVSNVHLTGTIIGGIFTGGIVGLLFGPGAVTHVSVDAQVAGVSAPSGLGLPFAGVGGVVGASIGGPITQSSSSGQVLGILSESDAIETAGGIVGLMLDDSSLANSYSTAGVSSNSAGNVALGGVVGLSGLYGGGTSPEITNTYATGDVVAEDGNIAGGLAGGLQSTSLSNSFSASAVSGSGNPLLGGFVGELVSDNTLTHNYFDAVRSGMDTCYAGSDGNGTDCAAVNTAGAPDANYFFNTHSQPPLDQWDFDTIWQVQNGDYPILNVRPPAPPDSGGGAAGTPSPNSSGSPAQSLQSIVHNFVPPTSDSAAASAQPLVVTLNDFADYLNGSGHVLAGLVAGEVVHFDVTVSGVTEHHTITVKEVGSNYVVLTIASTPFDVRLTLGATTIVTIDEHKIMNITLQHIASGGVTLSIGKVVTPTPAQQKAAPTTVTSGSGLPWMIAASTVTAVGVAAGCSVIYRRRYSGRR